MPTMRMGELLVTKKILTDKQLDQALAEHDQTGRFLGEILVKRGWTTEEQAAQSLSEQLGLAYVDLTKYTVEPGITELLPEELARKYLALPLFRTAATTTIAMANPLDLRATDEIKKVMNANLRAVFATPAQLKKRIAEEYRKENPSSSATTRTREAFSGDLAIRKPSSPQAMRDSSAPEEIASPAPVVDIVDNLIAGAVGMGASDIHLEPQGEHFFCRYRVDGVLQDMPTIPKEHEAAVNSRIKIMAGMDIAEKRLPQDGRIQTTVKNKNVDLRISTFPTVYGENVVIRILDKTRSLFSLEDLGMSPECLRVFEQMIRKPHGIILVTGPTGAGKTSTLYAALSKINTIEKNIITLEDPIEYEIDRVRQSQVNVKAGLTFASGLRSIVRQDPDIIMIGEIRDRETAQIAIHAALTGHLVFSTLHTNDAPSAATRLVDMGIEPFLVSSSLVCVVAQRLVRVLCKECKELHRPLPELLEQLKIKEKTSLEFYREKGCSRCRNTGYGGRIGIFEMLLPDEEIKKLIDKKSSSGEIRELMIRQGRKTLRDDGLEKLVKGITSLSEILRVTQG